MGEDASKKKYAYLDHLSTAELESLLRAAALSEESDDPAMMDYLLEVIVKREQEAQTLPDVDKMRKEFETLYRGLEEPLYPCEEPNRTLEVPGQSTPKKRLLRRVILAAALVGILVAATCLPVFGFDSVVQMVACWTAEQFGFYLPESIVKDNTKEQVLGLGQVPEEYVELQDVLRQYNTDLVIPTFPQDFDFSEPMLQYSSELERIDFSIMYTKDNSFLIFSVSRNMQISSDNRAVEKDSENVEFFSNNGIDFYVYSNIDDTIASWQIDNTEYSIMTNIPISLLKEILSTIEV